MVNAAYLTKNLFGRKGAFRTGLFPARPIGLTLAVLLALGPAAWAQTVYTWTGAVSSDFSNPANWSGGNVAPTNNYPTALNARITVANASNYPLVYTSTQGYTLYAASGGGTSDRSLFIASGTNGAMEIQGGIFESQAVGRDGMANAATGSLTINGGQYINVNGSGAKTFLVVFGNNGTGTLTIQSGTFAVNTLMYGDSSTSTGTGYVYLNGGLLSVNTIVDSGSAVSYLYLNGGTLQARTTTSTFLNNLDNVYMGAGGAIIDTQSYSVTIPVALKHDPDLGSTPDGGLTKTGAGTLILSGANTYNGVTTVSSGILRISNASALGFADGTSSTGTVVADGARLELAGGITVSGEALTISGGGGNNIGALQSASGSNTWAGPVLLGANDTRIGANGSGQVLRVSGVIDDGPNSFNLIVRNADGGGETILSGQNTYGGATKVFVGVLKIDGGDDRLPTSSPLQIGNPSNVAWARFDLNGYNQQVAGLVSEGTTMSMTVTNSAAASTLTINNSVDRTYAGVISGNLSLVKQGSATQTLSGDNTYTGTTDVVGGALALVRTGSNNNISGSPAIRVGSGATLNVTGLASSLLRLASGQTLQGNGTVQGNVETPAGAFLGAGMSPGHLTITGNYTQAGALLVELAGYTQGGTQAVPGQWTTNGYDWVSVGGQAVLDGYLQIDLLAGFQPATGDVFNVLTAAGGITDQGLELLWQAGSLLPAQYWTYQIVSGQGSEQILQLQLGVPEPASLLLLLVGAAGLALARWWLGRQRTLHAPGR